MFLKDETKTMEARNVNQKELMNLKNGYQLRYLQMKAICERAKFNICNCTSEDADFEQAALYGYRYAISDIVGAGKNKNTADSLIAEWEEEAEKSHRPLAQKDADDWRYIQSLPIKERVKIQWPRR